MTHRWLVWPWTQGLPLIRNWLAITFGDTTISWRPLTIREMAHELAHSEQWRDLGLLFPACYLWASIRAVRRGGSWYTDNLYEREARAAAEDA